MKENLYRIAAVLALVIGVMAIFAGGRVLMGNDPGYYVIDWLPVYNFILGLLSAFVVAILIWKHSRYALPAAVATLVLHALVMIVLLTGYGDVVAKESILAMTIRIVAWVIIVGLLVFSSRRATTVSA